MVATTGMVGVGTDAVATTTLTVGVGTDAVATAVVVVVQTVAQAPSIITITPNTA